MGSGRLPLWHHGLCADGLTSRRGWGLDVERIGDGRTRELATKVAKPDGGGGVLKESVYVRNARLGCGDDAGVGVVQ